MAKIKTADQGFVQITLIKILFMALRVQRQAVGLECRYITLSMNKDLQYSNGSVAIRKLQSTVRTLWERMECEEAKRSSANEWGFRPMYSMT